MNETLLYIGSIVIILWGIAHIIPTKAIVNSFGEISEDNRKVLTMELIAEGLTLIFLGVLPLLVTLSVGVQDRTASIVYLACAVMLLAMAVLTGLTGARTPTIWYKLCPAIKTLVAVLFILSTIL
ncbi:hypothetical protein ACFLXH_02670 [Chloroflexota bacterium]